MSRPPSVVILAVLHAATIVLLGYTLLGLIPMLLFASGFVGGLIVWLASPDRAAFKEIRWPFAVTLALFVAHKVEEREMDFFPALSTLTGVPVPEQGSPLAILLYVLSAAWLLIPVLMKPGGFGHYLAWTFFISMGGIELAHFVFPLFTGEEYGYFPGLATAAMLAPAGWWGAYRLAKASQSLIK